MKESFILYPVAFSADFKEIYLAGGMKIVLPSPLDPEKLYKEFPECKNLPLIDVAA